MDKEGEYKMNKIYLFASKRQIEQVVSSAYDDQKIVLVVRNCDYSKYIGNENIVFVSADDIDFIYKLKAQPARLLCCHEEGIYWLKEYNSSLWEIGFNTDYFNVVTKSDFKYCMRENGVNTARLFNSKKEISNFPVIAKPDIGFGSIGVQMINSLQELDEYTNHFDDMISCSGIKKYHNLYFKNRKNFPVYEEFILGDFYRTPFVIENGKCKDIFPVKGITISSKRNSSFHWTEFEYDPKYSLECETARNVAKHLTRLFKLRNGSYVMEFIIDVHGKLWLLEFSPRQTSGRISHLIELSVGFSFEEVAVKLFEHSPITSPQYSGAKTIRLRLEQEGRDFPCIDSSYTLIEKQKEKSVYNDVINCCYYEKDNCNEK